MGPLLYCLLLLGMAQTAPQHGLSARQHYHDLQDFWASVWLVLQWGDIPINVDQTHRCSKWQSSLLTDCQHHPSTLPKQRIHHDSCKGAPGSVYASPKIWSGRSCYPSEKSSGVHAWSSDLRKLEFRKLAFRCWDKCKACHSGNHIYAIYFDGE